MCLGIPGQIVELKEGTLVPAGIVDFGGARREVCLAYTPDVTVGDYVVVHVGFAITKVDEAEAKRTYDALAAMHELGELDAMREADATLADLDALPSKIGPQQVLA
jgi:hydrogenase expression/formation protein HypC